MALPSNSQTRFAHVPDVKTPRSSFNRSHGIKTTFDAGLLYPIFCEDVVPGDTVNISMSHVARLATPIKPLMDNLMLDVFWFFVPNRLVWANFVKMMGEQRDPGDSTDFMMPTMTSPDPDGYAELTLQDYFGLPTKVPGLEHQSLPLRCYALIYDEWFRDQNLVDSKAPEQLKHYPGPDDPDDYVLLRRGKRHDYFTSSLPFPQKGDTVSVAIGGTAPLSGVTPVVPEHPTLSAPRFFLGGTSTPLQGDAVAGHVGHTQGSTQGDMNWDDPKLETDFDDVGSTAFADLSNVSPISINSLRSATALQRLLENDARGGSRYTENIRIQFGVTSPDARLQRPEYLGGGTHMLQMSTVPQTSETDGTAQGNLSAFAVSSSRGGSGFVQSFTEHGTVIGLISARTELTYQQGLQRQWSRMEKLDFYFPVLAHLGEQAVLNKELYAQGSDDLVADAAVWGYQERWSEMRYKPSQVTGLMRSNAAQPLDIWHLSQDFDSLPVLNETFIGENPPIARVVATPSEPHFIIDAHFKFIHVRPMPTYSVPSLTDRF